MKSRHSISSFEDNLKRYAVVTKDNKINIWDTAAGSLRHQCFSSTTSKQTNQYTCIAWGKSNIKTSKGDRAGANDVVVGTINGAIHIWDVLTLDIALSLGEKGEGHVGAVNDVAFHHSGANVSLFSCGADGQVIQWDLKNKKPALAWKANAAGVQRIAVHSSSERGLIATAESNIKVWDLSSQKTLIKFSADRVSNLQFTPDGEYLFSTGVDRLINMWSCSQQSISANKQSALRAFSCDSIPLYLSVTKKQPSKNTYLFLAITEGGLLNVFDSSIATKGIAPASCTARLDTKQKPSKANGVAKGDNTGARFIDAHFYDGKDLLVVVGSDASPTFQRISFASEDGTPIKSLTVQVKQPAPETSIKQNVSKTTTLNNASIPPPNVVEGNKKRKTETTIASVDSKKIAVLEKKAKEASSASSTFQTALEQAIHTGDQQLLAKCFSISNTDMINSTLQQLAPSFITPLVRIMLAMVNANSFPQSMYSFLHGVLTRHTSLLMSSGALRECAGLYSAISARSSCYLDLLKAKGRIDLFLSHLDQSQQAIVVDANAKNVYRETEADESSEEEEEGDEEGQEEEEASGGEGSSEEDEDMIKVNGNESEGEGEEDEEEESEGEEETNNKRKRDAQSDSDDGSDDDSE